MQQPHSDSFRRGLGRPPARYRRRQRAEEPLLRRAEGRARRPGGNAGRLGAPPPRPRRPDLPRPARQHRPRPGRRQPADGAGRPRGRQRARAASTCCRSKGTVDACAAPGTENANLPTGAIEVGASDVAVLNAAKTPPFYINEDVADRRDAAAALPLPRPAPRAHAQQHRPAPPGRCKFIREFLDRRGLHRDRDADPGQPDAGGRARLPGAEPRQPGQRSTRCRSRRSSSSSC